MDELVLYNKNEIEKKGKEILDSNKFFLDLCNLMSNMEFLKFYDDYFKDWSDIQCMIFYMKLYSTIDYEFQNRYNEKISDSMMTFMLKEIMSDKTTRGYALDLFKDFKETIGHNRTKNFRSLLNFDNSNIKFLGDNKKLSIKPN